jgi:hypothetical protein
MDTKVLVYTNFSKKINLGKNEISKLYKGWKISPSHNKCDLATLDSVALHKESRSFFS